MGIVNTFSKLYKKEKAEKRKPTFNPKTYTKWKKVYEHRFEQFNQMFPHAHNITYKGILDSDFDIEYIIPVNWGVELELDDNIPLPVKQVKENKSGSKPWQLYENPDIAKEYYLK